MPRRVIANPEAWPQTDEQQLKRIAKDAVLEVIAGLFPHCEHVRRLFATTSQAGETAERVEIRILAPRLRILVDGVDVPFQRRPNRSLELLAALVLLPLRDPSASPSPDPEWCHTAIANLADALSLRHANSRASRSIEDHHWLGLLERRLFYLRRRVLRAPDAVLRRNGLVAINRQRCSVDLWDAIVPLEQTGSSLCAEPCEGADAGERTIPDIFLEREPWGHAPWLNTCRDAVLQHVRRRA